LNNTLWIAIGVLHLLALVDIWASRLTRTAKVLWSLMLVFLPLVGLGAWLLTRGSAHQPPPPVPEQPE
jgi:hypothetical protein